MAHAIRPSHTRHDGDLVRDAPAMRRVMPYLMRTRNGSLVLQECVYRMPAALAWLSGRPGVTSVIIGARTMKQLTENLKAAEVSLSGEERTRLDELSAAPVPYPQWMIGYMQQDR